MRRFRLVYWVSATFVFAACFACRDALPTETPAPMPGTRTSCGERLREATPSPPSCSLRFAAQIFGLRGHEPRGEQAAYIVPANRSPDRAPGSGPAALFSWDADTGRRLSEIAGDQPATVSAALSPNGGTLALGTLDGNVQVWDIAVSADGEYLAVAASAGIPLYRMDTYEWVRTFGDPADGLTRIAFSPDGATLASSSVEGGRDPVGRGDGSQEARPRRPRRDRRRGFLARRRAAGAQGVE